MSLGVGMAKGKGQECKEIIEDVYEDDQDDHDNTTAAAGREERQQYGSLLHHCAQIAATTDNIDHNMVEDGAGRSPGEDITG